MKVAIVLPTYNERENVGGILETIFSVFRESGIDGSVIVVDDESPDGTARIVKELSKKHKITIVERKGKRGLGSAYLEGFKKALENNFDVIMVMDADFSHNPKDIPRLIGALSEADVVVGSRKINSGRIIGWGPHRRLISWGGGFLGSCITGMKVRDITSGYRAYRREVLQKIDTDKIRSNGYAFLMEILYRIVKAGFSVKEIPIVFENRRAGKSKLSVKDAIEFFKRALVLRFS